MSIVYTADVFCDGENCSIWTHGATSTTLPGKKAARHSARSDGFIHVDGKDYCRHCRELHYKKALEDRKGKS